ncbi:MAG: hypothetical protein DRR42_10515 [Gammaproteobacteria bacterium]|nr:MAG: hypothetical protein DRQ98_13230 [Gammaproteobacteria bacterium]RLA51397.1 MAG: hypothetical protein DRR42_10515 [Gammaproteobacteria bacterium]
MVVPGESCIWGECAIALCKCNENLLPA